MSDLEQIKAEVFAKRPVLREIADKFSDLTLKAYIKDGWQVPDSAPDESFLSVIKQEMLEIFGDETASALFRQLSKKPLISTIDHLGIWNHPIFVNADLIFSLHFSSNELMPVFA